MNCGLFFTAVFLLGSVTTLLGQEATGSGSSTSKDSRPAVHVYDREHRIARQKWQLAGRRVRGENSAELRARALQQKVRMRAAHATVTGSSIPGEWVSLGPAPLPSDASGTGLQDYNWVSGRATAVTTDPNDASGNTVFVGGAYGGVWKSTNAGALSQDPSAVIWAPLTDIHVSPLSRKNTRGQARL